MSITGNPSGIELRTGCHNFDYIIKWCPTNDHKTRSTIFQPPFYCYDGVSPFICGTAAAKGPIANPPDGTCVNIEHRWNDIDRGKPKDSERNVGRATLSTTNATWTALGLYSIARLYFSLAARSITLWHRWISQGRPTARSLLSVWFKFNWLICAFATACLSVCLSASSLTTRGPQQTCYGMRTFPNLLAAKIYKTILHTTPVNVVGILRQRDEDSYQTIHEVQKVSAVSDKKSSVLCRGSRGHFEYLPWNFRSEASKSISDWGQVTVVATTLEPWDHNQYHARNGLPNHSRTAGVPLCKNHIRCRVRNETSSNNWSRYLQINSRCRGTSKFCW
jgi:hypothetical protein